MEYSWNDGGKTQYYVVILDQLQGHSGGLVWALESCVRGPLTESKMTRDRHLSLQPIKRLESHLLFREDP